MKKYNPKIHKRKSIRLKGYDYAQAGLYFVTICTNDRKHLFGEIINGEIQLNLLGKIAQQEWINTTEIRKNCTLGAYIIMPNHMHAIISIDYVIKQSENKSDFKSPSQTIGAIIRGYKGATTKKIKEIIRSSTGELQFAPTDKGFAPAEFDLSKSIWQRNYYEHIIRNDRAFSKIENYIINNLLKWEEDKFYKND